MKKGIFSVVIVVAALISFVGGFCAPFFASASTGMNSMMGYSGRTMDGIMETMHASGKANALMPCCNTNAKETASQSIVPSVIKGKINFDSSRNSEEIPSSRRDIQQNPIDTISLTSPPGGGLVSNVLKKE